MVLVICFGGQFVDRIYSLIQQVLSVLKIFSLDEQNPLIQLHFFFQIVRFAEVETHLSQIIINILISLLNLNKIVVEGPDIPFLLAVSSCDQAQIVSGFLYCIVNEFLADLNLLKDFSIILYQVSILCRLCCIKRGVVIFNTFESLFDLVNKLGVWSLMHDVHLRDTLSENEAGLFRYFLEIR